MDIHDQMLLKQGCTEEFSNNIHHIENEKRIRTDERIQLQNATTHKQRDENARTLCVPSLCSGGGNTRV